MRRAKFTYPRGKPTGYYGKFSFGSPCLLKILVASYGEYTQKRLKLKDQNVNYLLEKVKEQEAMIKELVAKADMAVNQVQSIACKALDTSAQRFITTSTTSSIKSEEKT